MRQNSKQWIDASALKTNAALHWHVFCVIPQMVVYIPHATKSSDWAWIRNKSYQGYLVGVGGKYDFPHKMSNISLTWQRNKDVFDAWAVLKIDWNTYI